MCRTVGDAARVLDALKDPERGYFDPRDPYSGAAPGAHSEGAVRGGVNGPSPSRGVKPLAGMRVGVVREYMVKHVQNDAAISDQIDGEIKSIIRDKLGAEIVESVDPLYPDDPAVPNMGYRVPAGARRDPAVSHARLPPQEDQRWRAGVRRRRP